MLLELQELAKTFATRRGWWGRRETVQYAVDGVTLQLAAGETLGLVGESGCGKSTLALTILRLHEATSGRILFEGRDITHLDENALRPVRRRMQMIFQDPLAALNPRLSVGQCIAEPLVIHGLGTPAEQAAQVAQLLERVGLSARDAHRRPHEFSGGQQQRIGIARALALEPRFILCDEPVSALDVSVQAQILNLLQDLQTANDLAYLFISHNIAVTAHISHRIAVMYLGRIVECGPSAAIVNQPQHPYTQALLAAIPPPEPAQRRDDVNLLLDDTPHLTARPASGCVFRLRCPKAQNICADVAPEMRQITTEHQAACYFI